jgi:hypothetical protein
MIICETSFAAKAYVPVQESSAVRTLLEPKVDRLIPSARSFLTIVIARCAKRAVAIQLDCFVATLLAMTAKS